VVSVRLPAATNPSPASRILRMRAVCCGAAYAGYNGGHEALAGSYCTRVWKAVLSADTGPIGFVASV
jgi:hypothetical protein